MKRAPQRPTDQGERVVPSVPNRVVSHSSCQPCSPVIAGSASRHCRPEATTGGTPTCLSAEPSWHSSCARIRGCLLSARQVATMGGRWIPPRRTSLPVDGPSLISFGRWRPTGPRRLPRMPTLLNRHLREPPPGSARMPVARPTIWNPAGTRTASLRRRLTCSTWNQPNLPNRRYLVAERTLSLVAFPVKAGRSARARETTLGPQGRRTSDGVMAGRTSSTRTCLRPGQHPIPRGGDRRSLAPKPIIRWDPGWRPIPAARRGSQRRRGPTSSTWNN